MEAEKPPEIKPWLRRLVEAAGVWIRCLASSALVKMRLVPQIQKTHRLTESEKKSAGFLNLWEIKTVRGRRKNR